MTRPSEFTLPPGYWAAINVTGPAGQSAKLAGVYDTIPATRMIRRLAETWTTAHVSARRHWKWAENAPSDVIEVDLSILDVPT